MRLGESCRVLIVEDDADALESLRLQMELWGNEVSTAAHRRGGAGAGRGRAAADRSLRHRPAGHRRLQAGAALRGKLGDAPVVFAAVTGYATRDDQERALAAGFDSFLVKPLEPQTLARAACAPPPARVA